MFLVDAIHKCGRWRQDLIDEDEDSLLGRKLDALADNVNELADSQVAGDQIFLLVDSRDI